MGVDPQEKVERTSPLPSLPLFPFPPLRSRPFKSSWGVCQNIIWCILLLANCTGWIYRSESTTSSARLSTVVCSARLRHTWRISAHRSPILPVGSIYVRLAATSSSFHATVARSSAVGPSLLRVRWPGTHCLTASETWLCHPALSDVI